MQCKFDWWLCWTWFVLDWCFAYLKKIHCCQASQILCNNANSFHAVLKSSFGWEPPFPWDLIPALPTLRLGGRLESATLEPPQPPSYSHLNTPSLLLSNSAFNTQKLPVGCIFCATVFYSSLGIAHPGRREKEGAWSKMCFLHLPQHSLPPILNTFSSFLLMC